MPVLANMLPYLKVVARNLLGWKILSPFGRRQTGYPSERFRSQLISRRKTRLPGVSNERTICDLCLLIADKREWPKSACENALETDRQLLNNDNLGRRSMIRQQFRSSCLSNSPKDSH